MLWLLAVLACVGCEDPRVSNDRLHGPATMSVPWVVIRDAYGDCWLLKDLGRNQAWVPMKADVCEHRPTWLQRP